MAPGDEPAGVAAAALEAWKESGKAFTLPIHGTSMFPFLKAGDAVRIVPLAPGELRLGDVMAFWLEGNVTVHRFAGRTRGLLRQKGDNLPGYSLIPPAALLGRVERIVSPTGERSLATGWGRWQNRLRGLRMGAFCLGLETARKLRGPALGTRARVLWYLLRPIHFTGRLMRSLGSHVQRRLRH